MKITKELAHKAYELSKDVFAKNNIKTQTQAVDELVRKKRMNRNSATDYIQNFKHLMKGQKFSRTLNAYSMDYFLENIYVDFGHEALSKSLRALKGHIRYYEEQSSSTMHKMRDIYAKFSHFILVANEAMTDLKNPKNAPADEKTVRRLREIAILLRKKSLVDKIKKLYNNKCQLCSTSIFLGSDKLYSEVHHIIPLGKPHNGIDHISNMICVCPNCHVQLDFKSIRLNLSKITIKHEISKEFAVEYNSMVK